MDCGGDGDGAGYDVLSFDSEGKERLLEVKTTNGSARTPFFLTRNECDLANERLDDWCIYRVHPFATQPKHFYAFATTREGRQSPDVHLTSVLLVHRSFPNWRPIVLALRLSVSTETSLS